MKKKMHKETSLPFSVIKENIDVFTLFLGKDTSELDLIWIK